MEARFLARVDFDGPAAGRCPELGCCHLWTGSLTPDGYARFWLRGTNVHGHTVAWELAGGAPPPPGMRLRHFACGRRACVNAQHVRPFGVVVPMPGPRAALPSGTVQG